MPVDIGETIVSALKLVGEFLVIKPKEVHQGGLKVVNVDGVFGDIEADVIGLAVGDPGLHAASGHP